MNFLGPRGFLRVIPSVRPSVRPSVARCPQSFYFSHLQRVPPSKGAAVRGYQEYLISVQEYFIFVQEYLIFVQVYFIFVQEYLISVQEYLIFVQEYFIFVQEYIFGKFTKDHLADLSRLLGLVLHIFCNSTKTITNSSDRH